MERADTDCETTNTPLGDISSAERNDVQTTCSDTILVTETVVSDEVVSTPLQSPERPICLAEQGAELVSQLEALRGTMFGDEQETAEFHKSGSMSPVTKEASEELETLCDGAFNSDARARLIGENDALRWHIESLEYEIQNMKFAMEKSELDKSIKLEQYTLGSIGMSDKSNQHNESDEYPSATSLAQSPPLDHAAVVEPAAEPPFRALDEDEEVAAIISQYESREVVGRKKASTREAATATEPAWPEDISNGCDRFLSLGVVSLIASLLSTMLAISLQPVRLFPF